MWIFITVLIGLSVVSTLVVLSALVLSSSSVPNEKESSARYLGTDSLTAAPAYID